MFKELFEDRPILKSRRDVDEFISSLYSVDVPTYKDYMHIINSLKRKPMLMDKSNMKYSKGKYDTVIGTEKGPLGRKFHFEIEDGYLTIWKSPKKGARMKDYVLYKEYRLEELF